MFSVLILYICICIYLFLFYFILSLKLYSTLIINKKKYITILISFILFILTILIFLKRISLANPVPNEFVTLTTTTLTFVTTKPICV